MRTAAIAALFLTSFALPMPSQTVDNLCPSQLVRWRSGSQVVEGWLVPPTDAGRPLQVQQTGVNGTKELAWDTPSLACYAGKGSRGNQAMIGLGLGALIGAGLGLSSGGDTSDCWVMCSAGEMAAAGAIGLGLAGAVIGAVATPGSVWTPLKPPGKTRPVGLVVNARGVGVQIRF